MYIPKRVMTVQGHPEFTEEIMKELLDVTYASGFFEEALFEFSSQSGLPAGLLLQKALIFDKYLSTQI